jgi:hypothetical protein
VPLHYGVWIALWGLLALCFLPKIFRRLRPEGRIEKRLAVEEQLNQLDELPWSERFSTLAAWVEKNLSPADQEWMYQQWQRVLASSIEEAPDEPAP